MSDKRLVVKEEIHKQLKVKASKEGAKLQEYVNDFLKKKLEEDKED